MGLFWNGLKNDIILRPLPRAYQLCVLMPEFVRLKTIALYSRILTDCYKHSKGLDDKQAAALWDNYTGVYSNATCGVIRLVAEAMADMRSLFLVWDKSTNVARVATPDEQEKICEDYRTRAKSTVGVACNFNRFYRTPLIKMYLGLCYGVMDAANTQMNLSAALQLKAAELRSTQGNDSNAEWLEQGKQIVEGLKNGQSVLIDKEDEIKTNDVDTAPVISGLNLYTQLIAGELGVSSSYVNGVLTAGMNSTGEAELEATEAGIENFYNSIYKPIVDDLFGVNTVFTTDNYRKLLALAQALPYLESSETVEPEQVKGYVDYMFGVK